MNSKKLSLITMDSHTNEVLYNQLKMLLGDSTTIERHTTNDAVQIYIDSPVALVSRASLKEQLASKFTFAATTRVIWAKRSISKQGIKTLLTLPMGTRGVLFVGGKGGSLDNIRLIEQLGISHLDLQPENPGQLDYDADMIITAGKTELLKGMRLPVVDIGIFRLDITTIVEVLSALDLLELKGAEVSARYAREIIDLSQEVACALQQVINFSNQLEVAINANHDGIIMTDENGKIMVSNRAAEQLFRLPKEKIAGLPFTERNGFPWNWRELHSADNSILRLNDIKLVVNANPVETPSGRSGTMLTFRDVTEIQRLEEMVRRERSVKGHVARFSFQDIVGQSEEVKAAIRIGQRIGQTDGTVLIYGESGTGKELFAQAIHNSSTRRHGPFVAVNFSAVAESLMESELFGYAEGAFTGARKGGKPGLFELAHGGSILLDEIGDSSPALQARLLRVLQEKQVMRVGGTKIIPVDVRVIAVTNKYLPDLIKSGTFREDLYYRLNVLPLNPPSLRERRDDIMVLLDHIFAERRRQLKLTPETSQVLTHYSWPGNIRELINLVEYLDCTTGPDEIIGVQHLPRHFLGMPGRTATEQPVTFEDLLEQLASTAPLSEYLLIMRQVNNNLAACGSAGRRSLSRLIQGMTEGRLRTRLRTLKVLNCVVLLSGRRGTRLTQRGIALLKALEQRATEEKFW